MTTYENVEELIQVLVHAEELVGDLIVEEFDVKQRETLREIESHISNDIDTLEEFGE